MQCSILFIVLDPEKLLSIGEWDRWVQLERLKIFERYILWCPAEPLKNLPIEYDKNFDKK